MKFKYKLSILKRIEAIKHKQRLFDLAEKISEINAHEQAEKDFKLKAENTYKITNEFQEDYSNTLNEASQFREVCKDKSFSFKAKKNYATAEASDIRKELFKIQNKITVLNDQEAQKKKSFDYKMEKKQEMLLPKKNIKDILGIFIICLFFNSNSAKSSEGYSEKMKELITLEETLKTKENKLKHWEEDLQAREKNLQELMAKISEKIDAKKSVDMKVVKSQTTMISKMKPGNAANLLATMNEELAVEILKQLKPSQVSQIFNNMKNQDVVRLTEVLSGHRKPNSGGMELRKKETE